MYSASLQIQCLGGGGFKYLLFSPRIPGDDDPI